LGRAFSLAAFAAALADPAVQARLTSLGVIPLGGSAAEMDRFVTAEVARWAEVVRVAGIRAE
jgi:tripartite-type tricarboxylate transporter receptor subunit TctC